MIVWRDAMAVGAPALDADNKRLVDTVNTVARALADDDMGAVSAALDALVVYARDHFAAEEALLAKVGFAELAAHRKMHADFATTIGMMHKRFATVGDSEKRKYAAVLGKALNDWFLNHVVREDIKLKPLLAPAPSAAAPDVASSGRTGERPVDTAEAERQKRRAERDQDVQYSLPPQFAHLLKRLEYYIPELPPAESNLESFEKLCEAAICRRLDKVMVFFQRYNPDVVRELPPTFLLSSDFTARFRAAIAKFILPPITESRQIRVLATSLEWAKLDADSFWGHVTPQLQNHILNAWAVAWDELKLIEVKRPDGQRVMQVKETTKELRAMLQPPTPDAYDIPRIGNQEIETFKTLLDPASDWWEKLNRLWQSCHDLYEQEKDPRVFQQKAREGALRDGLLATFNRVPDRWADFFVLACHRVFPRVSTQFLEKFTTNFGRTEEARRAHLPYTMRYLTFVHQHPTIREHERMEEFEWEEQMQKLKDYLAGREQKSA